MSVSPHFLIFPAGLRSLFTGHTGFVCVERLTQTGCESGPTEASRALNRELACQPEEGLVITEQLP